MSRVLSIFLIVLLLAALVLIRYYENELFYDPLLEFFKTDHSTSKLPDVIYSKLYLNVAFRYFLNSLVSLGILWLFFRSSGVLKLSAFIYSLTFVILILAFIMLMQSAETGSHMVLFYVRRFLIQPILLLILFPAFYFQKTS